MAMPVLKVFYWEFISASQSACLYNTVVICLDFASKHPHSHEMYLIGLSHIISGFTEFRCVLDFTYYIMALSVHYFSCCLEIFWVAVELFISKFVLPCHYIQYAFWFTNDLNDLLIFLNNILFKHRLIQYLVMFCILLI